MYTTEEVQDLVDQCNENANRINLNQHALFEAFMRVNPEVTLPPMHEVTPISLPPPRQPPQQEPQQTDSGLGLEAHACTSRSESREHESDSIDRTLSGHRLNARLSDSFWFNKDGILDKLGDISWPEDVEWIHKLSLDINQEQEVDVNDDLNRELAFYTQALEGTRQAFVKFQTMGLPFLRGFSEGEKEGGDMGLPFADGKESQRPGVSPWDRSGGKAKAGAGKDRKGGNGKRKSLKIQSMGLEERKE
ncbi:hypothetical protein L6452_36026 [Arctium lappa]|uniref:Uncharacterized protein n=1 Tax=Arctium lappa TaxID=4217 RepID=A0ACB8Y7B5_ARCLA|nr:hypothetical protein L6452_36026 [Arctium lappa]